MGPKIDKMNSIFIVMPEGTLRSLWECATPSEFPILQRQERDFVTNENPSQVEMLSASKMSWASAEKIDEMFGRDLPDMAATATAAQALDQSV